MASAKPDVLVHGPVMPAIIEQLEKSFTVHKLWEAKDREKLIAEVAPRLRALVADDGHGPLDGAFLSRFPKLEMISNVGAGYGHIDAKWAGQHGITVSNTPDAQTDEIADTAIGLVLSVIRELPSVERYLRAGKWQEKPYALTATLRERKAGILGLGRIGQAVARRLAAFDVAVAYCEPQKQGGVLYAYYADAAEMARHSDILVIADGSRSGSVDAKVLEALGAEGIVIDLASGSAIDQPALIEALESKTIAGFASANETKLPQDVLGMDRVVVLPQTAAASGDAGMAQLAVDNIVNWSQGKGPLTPVAETPWPPAKSR